MGLGRQLIVVALIALGLGAIASGCLTYAWVNENLGGDFANQETGAIDIGYTAMVFLIFTAVFAAPLTVIGTAGVLVGRLARRNRGA